MPGKLLLIIPFLLLLVSCSPKDGIIDLYREGDGAYFAKVLIYGKDYKFLIDTGSDYSFITEDVKNEITSNNNDSKLTVNDHLTVHINIDNAFSGPWMFKALSTDKNKSSDYIDLKKLFHVDGVLGMDFMYNFNSVILDLPQKKMVLNGPLPKDDKFQFMNEPNRAYFYMYGNADGVTKRFVIDTGCTMALVSTARYVAVQENARTFTAMTDFVGYHQVTELIVNNYKSLDFGRFNISNVDCLVYPDAFSHEARSDIVLGLVILSHYKIVLSIKDGNFWLIPEGTTPD